MEPGGRRINELTRLLVGLNNYLYYNKGLIIYLPVIQKISFITFLAWICAIVITIYNKKTKPAKTALKDDFATGGLTENP